MVLVLCAALSLAGCGHREAGPLSEGGENSPAAPGAKPAEASMEQQTEQKLDPLTKEDVELYLKVMRAAAERAKNPTPADKTALENASKILARGASGSVPTQDEVKTLERANLVALSMDQIVADDMKIDGRKYRGIAEAVESAVPNPSLAVTPGKDGQTVAGHVPTPLEERLSSVNTANEQFLTPYIREILQLVPVVRNPANLPK
jgi:hypothetical protein